MVNSLDQFTRDLMASVKWTDVDTVDDATYKALVAESFEFIQKRPKHQLKIMVETHELEEDRDFSDGAVTVVNLLNDNMPFLLDSVLGEVQARGIKVHMVLHPVLTVKRDRHGKLQRLFDAGAQGGPSISTESFISLYLERLDEDDRAALEEALAALMNRIQTVVSDWLPMRSRLTSVAAGLSTNKVQVPVDQLAESIQFLRWALDNNFTFLGMREYVLKGKGTASELKPKKGTGLGILRDPNMKVLRRGKALSHMTPEVRKFFFSSEPIIITKANIKSDVHRRAYMDYVGVKLYDAAGKLAGELRIVGLFTSSAYASKVATIPILRQKLDYVLDRSGAGRESHTGKALTNIVETFPRDELFQISNSMLADYAKEIETLDHSPRVKVLKRVDEFDRFASLLVFLPREQFSTEIRKNIAAFLSEKLDGRMSAFYPYFTEAPYVRIHFIIGRDKGKTPSVSNKELEEGIAEISRRWEDRMRAVIRKVHDRDDTSTLIAQYRDAFPVGYQEVYGTDRLMEDIHTIEEMDENRPTAVSFHRKAKASRDTVDVTLYNLGSAIPLSRRVPIFENLGFSVIDERSYNIVPEKGEGQPPVCQHIMRLKTRTGEPIKLENLKLPMAKGFMAVWAGEAADDRFNEIISLLGVKWQDAAMVRGLSHYLRQINVPYEQDYMAQVLVRYAPVTQALIDLFHARFDPEMQKSSAARVTRLNKKIDEALEDIPSLDEDQIIRSFRNLIMVLLRTNIYQRDEDGLPPEVMAFKFDSSKVEGMPEPRPYREIFVYSPKVEGVHLRFGKIARGGLRWSDRHQDFRTEVLGLVKAQLVKNSVIVPTGSKGGFVPKDMPLDPSREAFMAHGIAAYKRFINALLSLTDNMDGKKIVPPANTVRYDDDDPYLVVAADKGTASFSDIANKISVDRGFWLGDAFASGGSQGYDHKKMGITARGAWEAVKRHFREMDRNIQRQAFTVVGVGDMSGDVFGNGMLLSKATKLVAAFDHRDIFIDPDPDPKVSWAERKRLFDMGRSSWQDYNRKLISKGGGVFSRAAKSISLSSEMQALLGVAKGQMSPNELMRSILKADADLMWFGGIGTYVRGDDESNGEVGDRANDAIRVKASELRVKVIGEGANLGITQEGRMDFAAHGGRVNTDAIDNSAGVNSSDLEVNIKIALGAAVASSKLTEAKRNKVLASMTEEVAARCLVNNYRQSLTISLEERRGLADLGFQQRLMWDLEKKGLMSRAIEGLPEDSVITERFEAGNPLTRPELATLLGFSKIDLFNELVEEEIISDPYFNASLKSYFPEGMQGDFASAIRNHPLRANIIATQLTNDIINRGGSTMVVALCDEAGRSSGDLAAAYTVANEVLGLDACYAAVDALDNKVAGDVQLDMYMRLQFVTRRKTAWFLMNGDFGKGLKAEIKAYKTGLDRYLKVMKTAESKAQQKAAAGEIKTLIDAGMPKDMAVMLHDLMARGEALDVVKAGVTCDVEMPKLARADQQIDEALQLGTLIRATETVPVLDVYDRWALNAVVSRVQAARRELAARVAALGGGFDDWVAANELAVSRTERAIAEILEGGDVGLAKLIVAVGQVDDLAR